MPMTRRKKPKHPPDVVLVEVENPYKSAGNQLRIMAAASTRDDPLRGMLVRRQIDTAQYEAGRLPDRERNA